MRRQAMRWVAVILMLSLPLAVSYAFALLGEPSALWLWQDIIGHAP